MVTLQRLGVLLVVGILGCASSPPAQEATPVASKQPDAQHLLVVMRAAKDGVQIVSAKVVPMAMPLDRGGTTPGPDWWQIEMLDRSGKSVSATKIRPPDVVRGEFPGSDGSMEAHQTKQDTTEFIVRFPVVSDGATIKVSAPDRELGRAAIPEGVLR